MELNELYGKRLIEINKRHRIVKLTFESNNLATYILEFEGFVFETETSPMNQKVMKVSLTTSLGMKAVDALNYYYNAVDYNQFKQIFVQFEENTFRKNEIICVCKSYTLKSL